MFFQPGFVSILFNIITFSGFGDLVASYIGSHLLYTLRIFLGVKEARLPVKNMAKYWKSAREN